MSKLPILCVIGILAVVGMMAKSLVELPSRSDQITQMIQATR